MKITNVNVYGLENAIRVSKFPMVVDSEKCNGEIIDKTKSLAQVDIGTGHDNFLKGVIVQFDMTFTNKMSVELERYHFIDFISSQSTMHRITKFDLDKAYCEYVDKRIIEIMKEKVKKYNYINDNKTNDFLLREVGANIDNVSEVLKELYLEILYSNPCGMELTAGFTTNYQQLKTMYYQRRDHRLLEWREFCKWIETLPKFKELVIDK